MFVRNVALFAHRWSSPSTRFEEAHHQYKNIVQQFSCHSKHSYLSVNGPVTSAAIQKKKQQKKDNLLHNKDKKKKGGSDHTSVCMFPLIFTQKLLVDYCSRLIRIFIQFMNMFCSTFPPKLMLAGDSSVVNMIITRHILMLHYEVMHT